MSTTQLFENHTFSIQKEVTVIIFADLPFTHKDLFWNHSHSQKNEPCHQKNPPKPIKNNKKTKPQTDILRKYFYFKQKQSIRENIPCPLNDLNLLFLRSCVKTFSSVIPSPNMVKGTLPVTPCLCSLCTCSDHRPLGPHILAPDHSFPCLLSAKLNKQSSRTALSYNSFSITILPGL